MQFSNLLVGIGAALVIGGVVLLAIQVLLNGRLSDATQRHSKAGATLEPSGQSRAFKFKRNWPGIALIAAGCVFLLSTSIM
jgi:drug/metabolite transporter (DMT)-like permease